MHEHAGGAQAKAHARPLHAIDCLTAALVAALTAFLLVGSGFIACAVPPFTTEALARATSEPAPQTGFSRADLVLIACATQDYAFANHDADALARVLAETGRNAADARARATRETHDGNARTAERASTGLATLGDAPSLDALAALAEETDVAFGYDADTVRHLDDCHRVALAAYTALGAAFFLLVLCAIALLLRHRARTLAHALVVAGVLAFAMLALAGALALIDFSRVFAAVHHAFFPQGNWTFPNRSLLIRALPEGFWVGMGAVWLAVTLFTSILVVLGGIRLARQSAR